MNTKEDIFKITNSEKIKDIFGDNQKGYIEFERNNQLTVGELKTRLEKYPDDAPIFMESSNAYNQGYNTTMWSQKALDTYPCETLYSKKLALMIVGNIQ